MMVLFDGVILINFLMNYVSNDDDSLENWGGGIDCRSGILPFPEGSATAQPLPRPKSPQLQHQQDLTIADDTD